MTVLCMRIYCAEVFLYSRVITEQVKLTGRQKKNEQQYKSFKEMSGKETQTAKMIHAELKLPNKPGRLVTNFEIQNLNQNQYI